jgi:phosphopantothenoylcysteine decarboxylase/phosphopantothenate--cysteine ligase
VVRLTGATEHIEICGKADVLLVAPATANTLVKLSLGIADNAALTCALAAGGAKVVKMCRYREAAGRVGELLKKK